MDRHQIIAREADRLAEVLSGTAPDAQVPTCPDWSARDLLWHLTEVHMFWAGILSSGALSHQQVEAVDDALPTRPPSLEELLALRGQATYDLITQLGLLGDDIPRWTWWCPNQTVGFSRRMQTYEATMHRVDAELTGAGGWSGRHPEKGSMVSGTWAVRATEGTLQARFTATVEDLALWAWGRGHAVTSKGDGDAVAAMTAVIHAGIQ